MDMERYGRVHINNGLQPNPFMENHTDSSPLTLQKVDENGQIVARFKVLTKRYSFAI